ncbi:MAG: glycoside hydrolase family 27 protein [Mycobacterium sp.]|nr:glycoside hydrolase family 27 protein [Mycobacterium sp.]
MGIKGQIGAVAAAALVAGGLSVVVAAAPAQALDNGLARTPPMGFNDWNAVGCNVNEQLIKNTADLFVSTGLKAAGYQYVNIDDCWMTHSRDANGRLVPDPGKFPDGIKGTADYVHSKGLKLGIYEDAGTMTCAGFPGSLGHEAVDAQTFADWGVDYLKYDNCFNPGPGTQADYIARYTAMRDALAATGRPIVYSIATAGQSQPWTWGGDVVNMWRTTGDISDGWSSLKSIIAQNAQLAQYARPGAWNDPDMLEIGNGGMTDTEYETHFSMWAEMAAPLLIGTDLRNATPETLAILGNKDVIAVDQDPLGMQGTVIAHDNGTMVFNKPLANGDHQLRCTTRTTKPRPSARLRRRQACRGPRPTPSRTCGPGRRPRPPARSRRPCRRTARCSTGSRRVTTGPTTLRRPASPWPRQAFRSPSTAAR